MTRPCQDQNKSHFPPHYQRKNCAIAGKYRGEKEFDSVQKNIDRFMREAINLARQSFSENGVPIGSVLVRGDSIIGRGHYRRVQHGDATAHAEIDCLRNAGRQTTYRDTVIYSTLMPCAMCAGAVVQFGIAKIIAGERRTFDSSEEFMREHGVEVVDLDLQECFDLLRQFAEKYPAVWREDIGLQQK